MSSTLIQELKRDNLCTYFVLPLLRLNKFSFVSSNFINSFLTKDHKHIVVQVYDVVLIRQMIFLHPGYKGQQLIDGYFYLIFSIQKKRQEDVEQFVAGHFSKLSKSAKEMICQWSGLAYKQPDGPNRTVTDMRLLALSRHDSLKKMWEEECEIELNEDDELLDIPDQRSFIDIKV